MIEFEVKPVEVKIGIHAGKTMYQAVPKTSHRYTSRDLEDYIVNATSLARGDVRNALTSLAEFVNIGLKNGASVELSDLGLLKLVVNSKQVEDPKEVSAAVLKKPQIRFYPKQAMRSAANSVRLKVANQYTKQETETTAEPIP